MFVELLGWIAAAVGACIFLPQVFRLFRAKTSAGISRFAWQLVVGGNIAWTAHGIITGHPNIWVPNVLLFCCTMTILSLIRRDRGDSWLVLLGPGLVLATVMIGLDLALGSVAFAIAAFIPSALGQMAQLRDLILRVNLDGVSVPYLAMNVLNQCLWLTWSVLVAETSITMVASSIGTLMVANLVWATLRRRRLVRPLLASF